MVGDSYLQVLGGGLVWVNFRHLPPDTPPQVVGHTRHERVTQKRTLICENVIRRAVGSPGGEAVVVEISDWTTVLRRKSDGSVKETSPVSERGE